MLALVAALASGCPDTITVEWPKDAVVTGVSPDSGPSAGGTHVHVYGFGFKDGIAVDFDGIPASQITRLTSSELTCVTPAGATGPAHVSARNPGGQIGTLANAFTYTDWFGQDWPCRREISVSGSAAGDQTDYQVKVVLAYDSDMKPDFSDLRFVQEIGYVGTQVPFWFESVSPSSQAVIWLKIPSIPSSGTSVYVYYGNPDAISASDFDATFVKDFGENGLIDLWHMDEGTGLTAGDSTAIGNPMTLSGFTSPHGWTLADGGGWGTRGTVGFSTGSALFLDGADDRLSSLNTVTPGSGLTVEAWIRGTRSGMAPIDQTIISQWNLDGTRFSTAGNWSAFDPGYGTNGTDGLDALLGLDLDGFWGGSFDGKYAYFSQYYNGSEYAGGVLRFDTSLAFDQVGSWSAYDPGANGIGIDPDGFSGSTFDGRYVYFTPTYNGSDYHGEVLRFDTQGTFNAAASWSAFDPGIPTPVWATLASMPTARSYCRAAETGGKIYVIGGLGTPDLNLCEAYDIVAGTWNSTPLASMASGRRSPAAASVGGKVYAIGGYLSAVPLNSVEEYDPVGDAWVPRLPMPTARWGHVCAVHKGKIYCFGGATNGAGNIYTGAVEAYNPATNTWSGPLAAMPTARYMGGAAECGGKIYVIGGQGPPGTYTGAVEIYNPETNTWSTGSPMPGPRHGLICEAARGKIYAMGGWNGSSYLSRVDIYNPETDSWSQGEPLSGTREHLASASVNGRVYVIGGQIAGPTLFPTAEAYDSAAESPLGDVDGYHGCGFDGRYVYFVPMNHGTDYSGKVLRYDSKGVFNAASSWEAFDALGAGVSRGKGYNGMVFDGTYMYFCPYPAIMGEFLRYDTRAEFGSPDSWKAYDPGENGVGLDAEGYTGGVFDGRYAYFTPWHNGTAYHAEVLRFDTWGDFAQASSWAAFTPAGASGGYWGAVFDGTHVLFVARNNGVDHGNFLRYDTRGDFKNNAYWTNFDPGSNGVGVDPDGLLGAVFDGRNIYFPMYNNGTTHTGEMLKFDTTGSDSTFKLQYSAANQSGGFAGAPFGIVGMINTSAGAFQAATNSALPAGMWTHVAMTYDGSSLTLYVGGAQAASKTATGTLNTSTAPVQIGGFYGGKAAFSGWVDEARVLDRALPQGEVLAHAQRRKYASPEPQAGAVSEEERK